MNRTMDKVDESPIFSQIPIIDVKKIHNDKTFIWNNDGSIGYTIKFSGINDSGFRSEDYLSKYQVITQALSRITSKEVSIQFHVVRNSKVNCIQSLPLNMPKMLHERVAFLKKLIDECEVFKNTYYISVNSTPLKTQLTLKEKIKSTVTSFKLLLNDGCDEELLNARYQSIQKRMAEISRIESNLHSMLKNLGLNAETLESREQYSELYRSIISPVKFIQREMNVDYDVNFRKDIFRAVECEEYPEYFILDDYFHQVFELDYISNNSDFDENAISNLINVPFEHTYTVTFRSYDKSESDQLIKKVIKNDSRTAEFSENGRGEVQDLEALNDVERMMHAEAHMAATGQCIVEFGATFTYRKKMSQLKKKLSDDKQTIEEFILSNKEDIYYKVFSKLGNSEWSSPVRGQWDAFCATLPATSNVNKRKFETSFDIPEKLAYLLPLFGRNRDDLHFYGINYFFTDDLTTETFDLFDPNLDSWGTLISGDMGSGKSVAMNIILANSLTSLMVSGKMPLVRLVDYGGVTSSFYKQIKILKGEIINVSKSKKPKINPLDVSPVFCHPNEPKMNSLIKRLKTVVSGDENDIKTAIYSYYDSVFDHEGQISLRDHCEYFEECLNLDYKEYMNDFVLKRGECVPAGDKLRTIMSVLEIMLSSNPENLNTFSYDFKYDDFLSFVLETYHSITDRAPKIRDIVNLIKECIDDEDSVYSEIVKRLSKWTIDGQYKMFDADTDVDLENDVIMFDLFGVKKDPFLNAIYTTIIMELISTDMFEKMDRHRVCLMDEAHQALESEGIRKTLVSFMRLSRKYKFPVLLASQLPTDWFEMDAKVGKVIVSQATRYIFCGTKEKIIQDDAQRLYTLTASEAASLGEIGVRTQGGTPHAPVYSKFLMVSKTKSSREVSLYRNILSPFEMTTYSSSKEDNAIFRFYLIKKKMSALDACSYITDKKHIGDSELIEFLKEGNHTGALSMVEHSKI